MQKFLSVFVFVLLSVVLIGCEEETIENTLELNMLQESKDIGYVEVSDQVVLSTIIISQKNDKLIAEANYLRNSLNDRKVFFEINQNESQFDIKELSGLKRSIQISKDSKGEFVFKFYIDKSVIVPDATKLTFTDLIAIIKNSNIIGQEIIFNEGLSLKKADGEVEGTFNSFSSRCSTARAEVEEQIESVEGYATTSGIDCHSIPFFCWCSATVDLNGAGGSW